ncbi:MAG: WG repeat-containing protein [Bacteroidales bacterium]|nr:WG repeat-containing protein [Bacteroidales bacterium]
MRKISIVMALLLCFAIPGKSQLAKWVVAPSYDYLELLDNGLVKAKKDGKVGLLSQEGKMLLPLDYDSLTTFSEDKALLLKNGEFNAIVNQQGVPTSVEGKGYSLPADCQGFSNGYLLVKTRNAFYFVNAQGEKVYGPYAKAQPFINGLAVVEGYVNLAKNTTDTYLAYLTPGDGELVLPGVSRGDLAFASSAYDGEAVVAIKKKFFQLNTDLFSLEPLSIDPANKKKTQIEALDKAITTLPTDDGYLVNVKGGQLTFDRQMRLLEISVGGTVVKENVIAPPQRRSFTSVFDVIKADGQEGLTYNGTRLLPPQFDQVTAMRERLAVVRKEGKSGLLTVDPKSRLEFAINNREPIGFQHQYFNTSVTAILPTDLALDHAFLTSLSNDCEIRRETRTAGNFMECNTLSYNCRLHIPADLTSELSKRHYYFALNYDGLVTVPQAVETPQWFVKLYDIELPAEAITLSSRDSVTVEFTLVKSPLATQDQANYFKQVRLMAPGLGGEIPLLHLNENQYAFRIGNIDQERVNFRLHITEAGCPTMEYPFEMSFNKGTGRKGSASISFATTASPSIIQTAQEQQPAPQEAPQALPAPADSNTATASPAVNPAEPLLQLVQPVDSSSTTIP